MKNPEDSTDRRHYCDLCCLQPDSSLKWNKNARMAMIDGPTRWGVWAFMCFEHRDSAGYRHSTMNTPVNREFRIGGNNG